MSVNEDCRGRLPQAIIEASADRSSALRIEHPLTLA